MNTSGPARQWPALRLHEYVEQIIDAAPTAPAILGTAPQDNSLFPEDYAQLDRRANMLAHRLLALGAGHGARVGVLLERSAMLPLAFLAVLKAGACYVPLAADLPPARLAAMVRQAGARVLIALDNIAVPPELLAALDGVVLRPQDALDGDASRPCVAGAPSDLAAILFTSGSTGQPKGVPLRHEACLNMALGHLDMQGITARDRVLLSSAPGFILGLRELCIPMLAGAAYVGVTRALLDQPSQLLAHMAQHAVSVALLTPSYLRLFDGAVPHGLRCIMTAGERPNADDARHYSAHLDYWNMHGATEVCGTICLQKVDPDEEGPIASGYPFTNMTVCLLDANGDEVGAGEIGEIHVMGVGVAPGYLDQPELTAAAFVATRYGRAYRTHDLGRWRADGRLDTLGRANDVIKVSGQSVSLGEIERTLVRHENVRRAFVLQHESRLIAFVESGATDVAQLPQAHWRTFLGQSLPAYMWPAHVHVLELLPVNSAGKADRMALLALAATRADTSAHEAPQGELEQRIVAVWCQVLNLPAVGRHDHFFALGGTSLLAIDVCQRLQALGQPVLTRTLLAAPTVAGLALALGESAAGSANVLAGLASAPVDHGPATIGQQDFWIAAQIGQADQGHGTIARVLQAHGLAPAADAWRDAWDTLAARHPALRASFTADDSGHLHWHSQDSVAPDFSQQRCASLQQAGELIAQHAARPFSLTQAPLARAGLVQVTGETTLFWFVLHHAVADGLSARQLQEELYAILRAISLPPAIDGMALASRDEQAYLASTDAARDRDWWQAELDTLAAREHGAAFSGPPTDLPRTGNAPAPEPAPVLTETLDGATVAALARLAQSHQASLHGLLLALLAAETRRRGGARHLLLGSAVSLRPAGADSALGHFVNLVPLALDAAPAQTFGDSVRSAQGSLAATIAHAAYPASLVYREFRQRHPHARPLGRSSLFDIALTANPSRHSRHDGAAFTLAPLRLPQERWHVQAGLDLSFSHEPLDDGKGSIELALVWNPSAYTQAGARAWLSALAGWARWLAQDPARAAQRLPALLPQEAQQLAQWEHGPALARPALRAEQLVQAIARATPALPAIVAADGGLTTYAQLDAEAERIAQALQNAGVGRHDPVGVLADCTVNLPAAILGIWKAGAVYLPLAVEQPPQRLAYMLRDAGATVLLAPDGHAVPAAVAECTRLILRPESMQLPSLPPQCATPTASTALQAGAQHDPAYIIYTSGTTGMPKGVAIRHDSLVNAILMTGEAVGGMLPGDRVALVATPGFDASLWELGLGLLHGLALVPVSHALRDDPWALKHRYRELNVSVAFHAPSYLRVSKDTPFDGLRVLITGGEAPSLDDVRHYAGNSAFYNAYGPTETCIIVSMQRILPGHAGALPVGQPLANQHMSLRRPDGERVPPGVPGELWLGGAGVADGYLNNPDLSARAFVDTAEGRFYRSGDLGRWNDAGQIELAGRIDHQIKLHGQRVELGEIEQAIAAHPAVREAAVLVFAAAGQTQALRAFACLHQGASAPTQEQWRTHLAERLPFHMLPAAVHVRAAMPVNVNGKIDRAALLAADTPLMASTPPRAGLETVIAALWHELLDCPVGREDNFFALGGNSLLAVTMVHRLEQAQQLQVAARELFGAPTLAGFAARVAGLSQKPQQQPSLADSDLATCGQREFWLAEMAGLDTRAFNMSLRRRIDSDGDRNDNTARWRAAWSALVAHNEALRTGFAQDDDGHLRRHVCDTVVQALELASFDTESELQAHIRTRQAEPLSMSCSPLWRAGLATLRGGGQWFWLALHHAVGDGRSLGILQSQLDALLQGASLPPQASYGRSVAREQAYLASPDCTADGDYWRTLLAGQPAQAFDDWPLAQSRNHAHHTVRSGHRFQARLDAATTDALKALARSCQASLHAVMLALLALEAGRRGQRSAFLLGTAASTREAAFEADLPGYYVNMLPLPFSLDAGASFGDLLRATQDQLGAALRHARYPFSRMYSDFWETHPQHRHAARFPLFDMAVSENPELAYPVAALEGVAYELASWSHAQDVVLTHELLAGGGMQWQWLVNAGVYGKADAQAWLEALLGWAAWLAGDTARAAQPLPALLPAEQAQLAQWERGPVVARPALRFHELVEQFADHAPHSLAVVDADEAIDYAGLDACANRIAHALLAQGCVRGQSVAVLADCTASLPAAILGIWKAGAVYLPLAVGQPAQRLAYMARDAGADVLLVQGGQAVPPILHEAFRSVLRPESLDTPQLHTQLHPQSRPHVPGTAQDPAYIIYTSGTTGMPKGVTIRHFSLVNAILMTGEAVGGMLPGDRVALVATPGFDASLWELGLGLLHGLALVPVSHALRDDPWALKRRYRELNVSVAFHAPSYLRVSKDTPFDGLRVLITGGEAPSLDDVRHYAGNSAFYNAYGPTETCIIVTMQRILPGHAGALPVGQPLANQHMSLRRPDGERVPPGVPGELWLGGAGVADGYLNNPDLSARAFVDTAEGRFYRSGDLGRWNDAGQIELAGRIDHQIKLHGQRVELGEIEQAIAAHPSVREAAVLVFAAAGQTQALRAFACLHQGASAPTQEQWRAHLAERLPFHMLPAAVHVRAAMPVNVNGKIDRTVLLASLPAETEQAGSAPQGALETAIAALWGELLHQSVSREDNFFALGGNSLLAVTMAHRLSQALALPVPARELFAAPELAAFAVRVEQLRVGPAGLALPAPSELATFGQREFWIAETAGLDTRSFNMPLHRQLAGGAPDLARWHAAWAALVQRHDALRSGFAEDADGQLRRYVVDHVGQVLEAHQADTPAEALAHIRRRQGAPLSMAEAPLWRAGLVAVGDGASHLFWMAMHHAVGDGQTLGILQNELGALLHGRELPALEAHFGHSAALEHAYLASPACRDDEAYWCATLAQLPASAFDEWALDHPRSFSLEAGCHRFQGRLDAATGHALKALARRQQASLHAVMLTLLALEVRRRAARSQFVLGTTASTREAAFEAGVAGYYVNMLPLACSLADGASFGALLRATQDGLREALQHARYPFARMYHDFWQEHPEHRHPARYPLFDLAVSENPEVHANDAALQRSAPTGDGIDYELTSWSPGQDMVLTHEYLADGGVLLQWQVNAMLYSRQGTQPWLASICAWAGWLAENPAHADSPLPALLPAEQALLQGWEHGTIIARPAMRFERWFETLLDQGGDEQAARPAVLGVDGNHLSYGALEALANGIANQLLAAGVQPGERVGVLTGRSRQLPGALLGLWKAGATYLPLAADLPPERLAFMARDAGIGHLLVLDNHAVPPGLPASLAPIRPLAGHDSRRPHVQADAPAYIIYTSGSTGAPKGTVISHAALLNTVLGCGERLGMGHDDRTLFFAAPSFDVSLSDICTPLAFGAALCPLPAALLDNPRQVARLLAELHITVADLTPTYLRLFDGQPLPSLRALVTGGEAPFPRDVALYRERLAYFNAYGPTENTITSSMAQLTGANSAWLSCGAPLPNTSAHVCSPSGQPLPPGVTGELWLGGAGLALSYLNRPELSAATFIDTPQGRRYRSGDLARWNAPGELEILGRGDDQVKLNGIRIELGEIEHALGSHHAIAQAACLVERDGSRHVLWAFARLQDGAALPAEAQWRAFLAQQLPAYMLPSALLAVPAIPVNAAGKVDKAALRALLPERAGDGDRELPQGEAETSVARVWRALLNQETVYRDDNFFALGGHSLLAISVAQQLEREFGHTISPRELFVAPTISELAARLRQLQAKMPAAPTEQAQSDRASEGQREFWVAQQAGLDTRGFNIALTLAIHDNRATPEDWRAAWHTLVLRHAALRSSFHEDEDGVLHCAVAETAAGAFECTHHADLDAARTVILARQGAAFDMGQAPLWRAGLALAGEQPIFWLSLHHAVGDGMSLGLLAGQLRALLAGQQLPPLPHAPDHGAGNEAAYLASPACEADAGYWQAQLEQCSRDGGIFEEWPLDFARPLARTAAQSRGGHALRVELGAGAATRLRSFARSQGASLHALMLTLMGIEVQRRSGRTRFLLGTASSTRDSARDADQVGYFVNMLPLACAFDRHATPEQALAAMQQALAQGLRHGRYPFARMYQQLRRTQAQGQAQGQAQHPARYPLFDMVVTENPAVTEHERDDDDHAPRFESLYRAHGAAPHYELRQQAPAQDIVLIHEGQADGSLSLLLYVNAALYERSTAQQWLDAIAGWAAWLADPARAPGSARPALLGFEEQLLAQWQAGATLPHPSPRLEQRVEHWASTTPDQPALVFEHGVLSYAELDRQAGALAQALQAAGVAAEDTVAVLCDHSHALPLAFLAILKAGGCYLPLVASLPEERLAVMADDARVRVLLVLDGLQVPPALAAYPQLRPESAPASGDAALALAAPAGGADALAYMIYTSGSTGKPKGVMLPHRGLANLAYGAAAALGINASDRVLLMSSPAFDAWISDVAMAWATGAALVPVLRADIQDVAGARARMARLGVTVATMSPSYLRLFEQQPFPGLRILMTVGEQPHLADARHYAAQLAYFNGYGPTETSAAASFARVAPDAEALHAGRPQANSAIYLRNSDGEPVPPGSVGQLWIGGMGLARGYVNQPEQTGQRFVQTAWGRNYNSGDLARWSADGQLQVLGRSDRQIKLRGQRIELDEIEARLCAWPGVSQALAVVAGATPALWAFVAMADAQEVDWRTHLAASLPSYMMPQAVLRVAAMPMTESGKIDQAALLALTQAHAVTAAGREGRSAPHAGVEQRIARLWAGQLSLESAASVARDDNFFDLGGNSLQVIAVISKVRREFECSINDLYEHPTLAGFAARCRPRAGHLQATLSEALQHWRDYRDALPAYETQREAALEPEAQAYAARSDRLLACDLAQRTAYRHVLLTGATGYLGAYLLRELLADPSRRVSVLVRGKDDCDARRRLHEVLAHYFGAADADALVAHAGLAVHAGDLRHDGFGLTDAARARLADGLDAVFHSAANVSHFGHYEEFYADNVASTAHLLELARATSAHFHLMSTISVCGAPPEDGFRLFTEDDQAPQADANYYVRTKQEAEQLVLAARAWLPNASIHRVGNLVFPAGAGARQRNIGHNAFFRHVGAMLHLGAVPDDVHVWMCHVDLVARGVLLLAESAQLRHSTHHLENARRDTLAGIMALGGVPASDFGQFIGHLQQAVDDTDAATALAETMENMGLYRGRSPQARGRRLEVATDRTQALLARLGLAWPPLPGDGANAMLKAAALVFPTNRNAEVEPTSSC